MTYGFTGTHHGIGMTDPQRASVRYLFFELQLIELHHGDCVGADAQADRDAKQLGAHVVIHPPIDPKLRAYCDYSFPHQIRPARPYLVRNRNIVIEGVHGLIAAPRQPVEPKSLRGEGTWTTIGYARKAHRPIWIVLPDGTWRWEPGWMEMEAEL